MEVHHHPHAEGKRLKHYLFEFFMLSLAVFCGFLAEYLLEHKIESEKERQYMQSMVADLSSETIMLQHAIQRATILEKGLDSLKEYLYDTDNTDKNAVTIYRQNAVYARLVIISFNDQTSIQLRNSGGMRLIRKINIADAIARYWKGINGIKLTNGNLDKVSMDKTNFGLDLFNRKYCTRLATNPATGFDIYSINPEARLMTTDPKMLVKYANQIRMISEWTGRFLAPELNHQRLMATDLLALIKKEYRLK